MEENAAVSKSDLNAVTHTDISAVAWTPLVHGVLNNAKCSCIYTPPFFLGSKQNKAQEEQ